MENIDVLKLAAEENLRTYLHMEIDDIELEELEKLRELIWEKQSI